MSAALTRHRLQSILVVLGVGCSAAIVQAQEVTAIRFYLVPIVTTSPKGYPMRYPKYLPQMGLPRWGVVDYGFQDVELAGAAVTNAQHVQLAANLDVVAIPQDLDSTINLTALSTVQQKLEGMNIPADWVTTNHTYRQLLRFVVNLFMLMQRHDGVQLQTFFQSGITVDLRVNQLSQAQRANLLNAAASLNLDTTAIVGPMPIRQALRLLVIQMGSYTLLGETF